MAAGGEHAPSESSHFTMDIHITFSKATPSGNEALIKAERETFVRAACAAFNSKQREVLKLGIVNRGVLAQEHIDKWEEGTRGELCKRIKPSRYIYK